jgi:predicted metal-dependent peptidase
VKPSLDEIVAREKRRIAAVRMQLLAHHPFWGYLLLETRLIPSPGLPCLAATDGVRRIWYNPTLTCHLPLDELGFVLAHEVGHGILENGLRRRQREPGLWNRACDFAVNRIVAAIPCPDTGRPLYTPPRRFLPGVGRVAPLLDDRFDGLTAEAIYEVLDDNDTTFRPDGVVVLELFPDGELSVAGPPVPSRPGGRLLRVHEGLDGLDLHVAFDEDYDAATGSEPDDESLRAELAGRLSRAVIQAEHAADPGHIPGDVRRSIARRGTGIRDESWQEVFRRLAGQALARDEYTLARPHRRWLAEGFLVPGLRADSRPDVVLALDTSASMSGTDLALVCAEIRPVLARAGEVVLVVHDADIQEVVRGTAAILRWLEEGWARGGGGTDHRPVFEWIAKSALEPELFVGLTDCASRYPDAAPGYPVVWVTPLHSGGSRAPWGTRLWVTN